MRLKNLNLFEKYIEKAVLAMGAVFALVVLWFFVLGSPHAVELTAFHEELKPGEIEERILKEADDLNRRISSRENPFGEEVLEVPPYTDEFRGRLTRPLIPVDRLTTLFGKPGVEMKNIVVPQSKPFYVPQPPAPRALIWDNGFGVLSEPANPTLTRKFENIIGDQKPRDFRWVSVSARFDLKRWRDLLSKKPTAEYQMLPKTWWQNRMLVTDVILQRQVQDSESGKWGEIQTLPPIPGNDQFDFLNNTLFSFRTERVNWAPPEKEKVLGIASIEQKRLPQPLFPDLTEGLWLPPDANSQTLSLSVVDQVRELVKQIEQVQVQIKEMKQRMKAGTLPLPVVPPVGGETLAVIPIDLPELEAQQNTLRVQLYEVLGIIEPIEPTRDVVEGSTRGRRGRGPITIKDVNQEESSTPASVSVWQHDISVEDGQSIRYRLIVKVLNPLFFRSQAPKEQQEEYFQKLTLISAPSEWTEPVQVLNEHHFFLSGANKSTGSCTIEVFCIFNGKWQKREFDVKPGDPIGQVVQFQAGDKQTNVNMNVGGVVVDIDFEAPSSESPTKRTTRLIFFDGKTNTLQTRILELEQINPEREELRKKLQNSN